MKPVATTVLLGAVLLVETSCRARSAEPEPVPGPSAPRIVLPPGETAQTAVFVEGVVDVKPELIRFAPPVYPDSLRTAGVQGRVVLEFIIDTLGRVEPPSLKVVESPHPGLSDSALRAVMTAEFRPGEVQGHRVRVLVNLPINFSVGGQP